MDEQKQIIDITGTVLSPGNPNKCNGSGKHGSECCCDECDYMMDCYIQQNGDEWKEKETK